MIKENHCKCKQLNNEANSHLETRTFQEFNAAKHHRHTKLERLLLFRRQKTVPFVVIFPVSFYCGFYCRRGKTGRVSPANSMCCRAANRNYKIQKGTVGTRLAGLPFYGCISFNVAKIL
jgi:hypothetical protein